MKKLFLCLFSLLLVTGCSFSNSKEDITIYTTFYPIEYFTDYLYGDYSTVNSIYPSSADLSSYSPTDKQKSIYSNSDIFIYTSIKKETFTTSKMIDKSLVNYNNNRPLGVMTIIISPETDNQMKTTPF